MTFEEIESACDVSQPMDFSRHELEGPKLSLQKTFHPFGFPTVVKTNSTEVLELLDEIWGKFEKQHETEPIRANVRVVESSSTDCPPTPTYRIMLPFLICVADSDNYAVVDLEKCTAQISISRAALCRPLYAKYFILGTPVSCIATRHATPVHAGCVALDGRGVLLCGDSGAGKSTLSFACARSGWTYTTDDASFLLNGGGERLVTGDCNLVRFRPAAAELFPELRGLEITPRAAGKPSIEVSTAVPNIVSAQTTRIDFIVFLNRRTGAAPELKTYRKDVARQFMRQVLFGPAQSRAAQYAAIERLLAAKVFELRYTELDWAVERLRMLVQEDR